MRRFFDNNIEEADVAILPKSRALVYAADPREELATTSTTNSQLYLEQDNYVTFMNYGEYKIEPNGLDNNFPRNFKSLLDTVYIGHGIKRTLINLLISGGVGVYKEIKEGMKIIRDWQLDNEIADWLESFDFHTNYIPELATDMIYVENAFTQFILNKGARVKLAPKIVSLKALSADMARIEAEDESGNRNHVFMSDWMNNNLTSTDIQTFPMFDRANPFKNPNSVMFMKMPTFGSTAYGRPVDIGATSMLKVLSLLPNFHQSNLTEKGFKWIVSISQSYYKSIQNKYGWGENAPEFVTWKKNFQASIDTFLSAPEGDKVQTRFMTEFVLDPLTRTEVDAVKITKLDDDTRELSEVGMSLHDTYTIGYVSANSIHPQLANINLKNHALSGSNLREAYEMHIKTSTPLMRSLLLHPANTALKINFPSKGLKIGFMDLAFEEFNKVKSTDDKELKDTKTKTQNNAIQ